MATVETAKVSLNIETAAQWFSGLSDEQQADFFIEVAKQALSWPNDWSTQFWYVGRHLSCSTAEACELVNSLHRGLHHA